jgi:hypothetical protein
MGVSTKAILNPGTGFVLREVRLEGLRVKNRQRAKFMRESS